MMMPGRFQQLLEKFSRGQCTPEEEQFIIDWYERIGKDDVPIPYGEEESALESRMWSALNPALEKNKRKSVWPVILRAAVITIPLLAVAAFYFIRSEGPSSFSQQLQRIAVVQAEKSYKNNGDGPLKVGLADGSIVVLEPSSELVITSGFGGSTREVHLHGEGFFSVKRNTEKPFLVYANEVVTRVLGTSFRIKAYDDEKEVTVAVKTGKVSVYANRSKTSKQVTRSGELILTPNQEMIYHRLSEVISRRAVTEPSTLQPDAKLFRMQFDNAEVSEILDMLAANYGVEIRYDSSALRHCRLTTSMSDEDLYERLEVICKAIGASYTTDDDAAITVKSDGC